MNFVFFGASEFAVKILETMRQKDFIPDLITTTPDKPKGRKLILTPSPVKIWAQKNNIPFAQPEKLDENFTKELKNKKYDLFIVAAYGKILPKNILEIPKHGTLNAHPSLLPKFRGPSPIQSFILSGEKETGITIILLDEEMDHGPIVAQKKLKTLKDSKTSFSKLLIPKILQNKILRAHTCNFEKLVFPSFKKLEKQLAELSGEILTEIIPDWIEKKIKPAEQNHSQATYTKKITKEDGKLDLSEPTEIIERKIRAFTPWPGAYVFVNNKRIIITQAEINKTGALKIKRVKPEGKNEMDYLDYLRGNPPIDIASR